LKIDASEFEGNIETLSTYLERKLQRKIHVHHSTLEIDDDLSHSKIRDALKHVLHKLEPQRYRVVTESGSIRIRKLEPHSHKVRQKEGTSPSAPQTLPYFFPR
jgi:hypothetical protein